MVERHPAGRACRDTFEALYDSYRKSNADHSASVEPHLDAMHALPHFPDANSDNAGPQLSRISSQALLKIRPEPHHWL